MGRTAAEYVWYGDWNDLVGPLTESAAAFFDLDRTLISGSSVFVFGMAAWRSGLVPTSDLIRDARNAIGFRLTGASDEKTAAVRDRILGAISGTTVADLRALGEQVIPRLLKDVRLESRGLIDLHHDAGRDTYIVSASPIEIVEDLADAMGMTGGVGTVAEIVDGVYTGRLAEPFCYGEGKVRAIEKLADERGYDLRLSYAYSDSAGDLPFLETVGHPVAVNADRALQSLAYHRGWPVVVFSRKAKQVIRTTTAVTGAAGLAAATYFLGRRQSRLRA
ncbi:MAG: HAD-IB family hydrolase [Acidimicrobiia bacterium]|nr:HAD-IB family hydrolase [Acidimicrobiia bacterium]MDH3398856.1 HAD-IB family hydrolase [Acidimicrobiia bacterium]MDH5616904.1 HAD-IB family hydrolase [Acidimicrobiia bacterium]